MQRKDFLLTTLATVPLAAFAQKQQKAPPIRSFKVDAGKSRNGDIILFKGVNPNDLKVSAKDTNGQLAMFEYTGLAKVGPSLHLHYEQDEIFYIVEGEYRFVVGNDTYVLKPGDTIFLPRKIPHTWIQLSDKGKLIYQLQPAGKIEDFFKYMNNIKTVPTHAEIEKIHEDHGMKLVGPGLTL